MSDRLHPGLQGEVRLRVTASDTAQAFGSGSVPVLATPRLVALMEAAAVAAVAPHLAEGNDSVGTRIDITHSAPTPVGLEAVATAELVAVEGRTLRFKVSASDAKGPIGEGTHERVVIDRDRFLARVLARGSD
jgi:fluoroacetyl-CoA thioesterase